MSSDSKECDKRLTLRPWPQRALPPPCDEWCIFPYQSDGNCAIRTAGLTQDQFARRCAERGRGLDFTEICP